MSWILNKYTPLVLAILVLLGTNYYSYEKGVTTTETTVAVEQKETYIKTRKRIDEAVATVKSADTARERLQQRKADREK